MKLKVEDDRVLQLKEMSEFLGVEFNPTVEDIRNFPDFQNTLRTLDNLKQSERSKREKSLTEILDDKSLNELLETKFEKPISLREKELVEFLDDRITLSDNIRKLQYIINNDIDTMSENTRLEVNKCINEILKSRIILNIQIKSI